MIDLRSIPILLHTRSLLPVIFPSLPTISLFDASGKLKWNKKIVSNSDNISFDLSSLPAGVYIMQIGNEIKKLIVEKIDHSFLFVVVLPPSITHVSSGSQRGANAK